MEKTAYEIEELLQEKLSCYHRLEETIKGETKAIAAMDLDSLWQSAAIKKQVAARVEALREEIISKLETSSLDMGMDKNAFSLAYMIESLPLSNRAKSGLRTLKLNINTIKKQVLKQAEFNQVQVRKHLMAVDDIMSVIGDNSSQSQYTGRGMVPGSKRQNCIIRAEV